MGKVEEMQEMEKDLVAMARQVEKLRSEVLNNENKAHGNLSFFNHLNSFWNVFFLFQNYIDGNWTLNPSFLLRTLSAS